MWNHECTCLQAANSVYTVVFKSHHRTMNMFASSYGLQLHPYEMESISELKRERNKSWKKTQQNTQKTLRCSRTYDKIRFIKLYCGSCVLFCCCYCHFCCCLIMYLNADKYSFRLIYACATANYTYSWWCSYLILSVYCLHTLFPMCCACSAMGFPNDCCFFLGLYSAQCSWIGILQLYVRLCCFDGNSTQ